MRFTNLTRHVEIGANCYLLEIGGKRIVLDSGMHPRNQGAEALPRHDLLANHELDAILISHAHQDHIGTLPLLMRQQPDARVFMTDPTRQLCNVMLHNSVNVMTKIRDESGIANYPLFTHREVDRYSKKWELRPLQQRFTLDGDRIAVSESAPDEPTVEFFDAGHILGAAGMRITGEGRTIFYTGDVNFENQTLSAAATFPEEPLDVLIMETTHGDSPKPEGFRRELEIERLAASLTAVFERGGCVLMPLFALGKTQEMLAMIYEFRRTGKLSPSIPIYIGGLSAKLTELYDKLAAASVRLHPRLQLLESVAPFILAGRDANLIPANHHFYALSSGMMTEKTLSNSFAQGILDNENHSIFFVGYADPASPAGKLRAANHGDAVTLDAAKPSQPLRCHVENFNFSGHSTRESIRDYANKVRPKKIVLVHGDPAAIEWFRATLAADLPQSEIIIPQSGVAIEL